MRWSLTAARTRRQSLPGTVPMSYCSAMTGGRLKTPMLVQLARSIDAPFELQR